MVKVVVIGANSNIARNFIYYLTNNCNIELYLYDIQPDFADDASLSYRQIDLLDKREVQSIDFNCDFVYCFTGKTGATKSFMECIDFLRINEEILLNILNEIINQDSKCKFVYPSSRLVYGENEMHELREDDAKEPLSIYAVQKLAAENYIKSFGKCKGMKYTIFRMAIPFGVLNPSVSEYGIVATLTKRAVDLGIISLYGSGDSVRTFTHIQDICKVLWEASNISKTDNDIFNIGGNTYSLKELAQKICDKYNAQIEYVPWPKEDYFVEVKNGQLNSDKLNSILDIKYLNVVI